MNYYNEEWTIKDLIKLIEDNKINLRPPYQRNFIWSSRDQKSLIDTLHKGYPLPNFFILKYSDDKYEMIDGQQRAVTIYKFINNEFADTHKKRYEDYGHNYLMDYKLNVVILENFIEESESKEEFFYLVNKRGVQLNPSEVNHAYYHDTDFMRLVTNMLNYQPLIELDIFTDKTVMRMNDRSLVEELAAYLFKGITDKRNVVEDLFEDKIEEEEMKKQYSRFSKIIDRISLIQKIKPINQTRYKQRNDFFTLFCFVDKHLDDSEEILMKQFNVLVFISDNGIITPSNDEYELFKEYAINCVSQSNSKHAREQRLSFFEALLANTSNKASEEQLQLIDFADNELDVNLSMVNLEKYFIVNIDNY
ncbi:MAG: DUF262 domain-containing protein [Paludibacteraceae bacterium]|nr:DUF262 domain-containing protein [Paludibacteraceae bacterium]